MTTISLPGLTGLAPPAASTPPDASPTGHAAGDGVFAGVIAAAVDAAGTQGDESDTTAGAPAFDMAQLLSGLKPVDADGATQPTGIASEIEHTLDRIRPDRSAGVERDESTTLLEAYEALMSVMLSQAQVLTPQAMALTGADMAGRADAMAVITARTGTPNGEIVGELAQLMAEPGAPAAPVVAVTEGGSPADGTGIGSAAVETAAAIVEAAQSSATRRDAVAVAAVATRGRSPVAGRPTAKLDISALDADPGRAPLPSVASVLREGTTETMTDSQNASLTARLEPASDALGVGAEPVRGEQSGPATGADRVGTAPVAVTANTAAPVATDAASVDVPVATARPAELAARLADTVQRATLTGDNEVRLVLNPPELGHLTVRVQDTAQGVRIAIDASSAAARDLIQQHLPLLQSALEARDMRVERVQVAHTEASLGEQATSQNRGGSGFGGQAQQGDQQSDRPTWSPMAAINRGSTRGEAGTTRDGGAVTVERTRPVTPARPGGIDRLA